MSARLMQLGRLISLAGQRISLLIVAIGIALLLSQNSAEAGIVTSMSDDSGMSVSRSDDHRASPAPRPLVLFLLQERVGGLLDLANNTSGTSSSSSSSSTSGPNHSLAAATEAVLLGGLPCSGWITPEAVQALPPLFPSGLFRPPCA